MLALALIVLAAPPPLPTGVPAPVTGPNPYLRQAKELYQKLDFEKCLQRLQQAPQWRTAPPELLEIELYAGMCAYSLNQRDEAEERFRLALRISSEAELPAYTSPKLVDFFHGVKRRMKSPAPAPEAKPEPKPEPKPAPPPAPVPPPPPPVPVRDPDLPKDDPPPVVKKTEAPPPPPVRPEDDEPRLEDEPKPKPKAKLVPPPRAPPRVPLVVEQPNFAQRHPAPIALGVAAVVALGTGIAFGVNAKSLETRANAASFESDFHEIGNSARTSAVIADVSYGISGAAALGAVLSWALDRE